MMKGFCPYSIFQYFQVIWRVLSTCSFGVWLCYIALGYQIKHHGSPEELAAVLWVHFLINIFIIRQG